jgi:hypothetical protein
MSKRKSITYPFLALPLVGSALTVLAGLSFLFVCMIIPLVGPSGSAVPYARQNYIFFLLSTLASLALSGAAVWSKIQRRRLDGSPLPKASLALAGLCLLILFALFAGWLKT